MSVCRMGEVPMCVEERRQSIPLDVDDKQKTLPMCVEPMRRGGRGLPAISGIVDTPADLPNAEEHWLENWLVKDAADVYNSEMALFSARVVSDGQKAWVYIGSIKGEPGVTFYPNVNEYGVISWTNDGGKENPQPRNITGKDGAGIQIFGTYNELPNALYHPEIAAAIVCRGDPEPYYLYENTGSEWFGRGSLKGDRGDMPFWFGTRAEYNALQTLDPDVCYCIEEGT